MIPPRVDPSTSQDVPKCRQYGPDMAQYGPKVDPRAPQCSQDIAQDGINLTQDAHPTKYNIRNTSPIAGNMRPHDHDLPARFEIMCWEYLGHGWGILGPRRGHLDDCVMHASTTYIKRAQAKKSEAHAINDGHAQDSKL